MHAEKRAQEGISLYINTTNIFRTIAPTYLSLGGKLNSPKDCSHMQWGAISKLNIVQCTWFLSWHLLPQFKGLRVFTFFVVNDPTHCACALYFRVLQRTRQKTRRSERWLNSEEKVHLRGRITTMRKGEVYERKNRDDAYVVNGYHGVLACYKFCYRNIPAVAVSDRIFMFISVIGRLLT